MDSEWGMFAAGATLLVGYLILSAMTEMGTRLPWRKGQDRSPPDNEV